MFRLLSLSIACLCAALALAAPALGAKSQDVQRTEAAVLELDRAKRSLGGEVTARRAALARSLARCKSKGKGWKKIKRIRNASQRGTYRRGARFLWKELSRVAIERAALDTYHPIFERFLAHFEPALADPTLQGGVEAQKRRLAFHDAFTAGATCKTFNKLTRTVRTFRGDATGDARAGHIYTRLTTYVRNRQAAATRKYWGSRYDRTLKTARQRLKDLGGNGGYADYFAFALALRV